MRSRAASGIVRVDAVDAVPWRNGGGVTRELLAWPNGGDWQLRISVAEIGASGPFSDFPGVDRYFAVLAGDGVRLATAGHAALELTPADDALHAFPGDVPTQCTLLGSATRDLNFMVRRAQLRLRARPLDDSPQLSTRALVAGLFATAPTTVSANGHAADGNAPDGGAAVELAAMSLAWWSNPDRAPRSLTASPCALRGWWFEIEPVGR